MRHLGYPDKIVRILENMQSGTVSTMRARANITEWFEAVVGVLQGCIISPLLFNIFLEIMMSRAVHDVDV